MKPEKLGKTLGIAFLAALILYALSFVWIEHTRHRKGPWQILFLTDYAGVPSLLVSQPALDIHDVKLVFPGQRLEQINMVKLMRFDDPTLTAPFGKVVFHDLTFLPGTLVFDFFGHEVELLPRALTVNKKEQRWSSGAVIEVRREADAVRPLPD